MKTNRDLYKATTEFLEQQSGKKIPELADFLAMLIHNLDRVAEHPAISLYEFHEILKTSFVVNVDTPATSAPPPACPGYARVRAQILKQIQELGMLKASGQLDNEYRYFGLTTATGSNGYNFDPSSYIECGLVGALGGWEDGDDTGREYVPGVTGSDSTSPVALAELSWEDISDFVWAGQHYE
jgi:hypothetical protein